MLDDVVDVHVRDNLPNMLKIISSATDFKSSTEYE